MSDSLFSIQKTSGRNIVIPPFIHGHLGFLPDTEVWVHLTSPYKSGAACEVLFTPYEPHDDNIMLLSCTLEDEPGAVNRLVKVIAELDIYIASLETSVVNHLHRHRVNLTLDWSTSGDLWRPTPSSQKVRRTYSDFSANFPVDDQRCVELFQRIVEECGDLLVWEERAGKQLPALSLRPADTPALASHFGVVAVKRHRKDAPDADSPKTLYTEIELPEALFDRIGAKLKAGAGPLHYILFPEAETRALRALFLRPGIVPRIVHLGFYHLDVPGALSKILGPLERAEFNILHCLLRPNTASRNALEAFLEYCGEGDVPAPLDQLQSPEAGERLGRWAAEKMRANLLAEEVEGIKSCDLRIGLPSYPNSEGKRWAGRINFGELLETAPVMVVEAHEGAGAHRPASAWDFPHAQERVKLIATIKQLRADTVPSIFLSYPHGAADHAELLKSELEKEGYRVVEHLVLDGKLIMDEVIQKITDCDYFIGIWHNQDDSGKAISTWLPIEWALARALKKKTLIVHSRNLHPDVWKSVNPDIAQIEYVDIKFGDETVPRILAYCRDHFVEEGGAVLQFRERRAG